MQTEWANNGQGREEISQVASHWDCEVGQAGLLEKWLDSWKNTGAKQVGSYHLVVYAHTCMISCISSLLANSLSTLLLNFPVTFLVFPSCFQYGMLISPPVLHSTTHEFLVARLTALIHLIVFFLFQEVQNYKWVMGVQIRGEWTRAIMQTSTISSSLQSCSEFWAYDVRIKWTVSWKGLWRKIMRNVKN